MSLEYGIVSFKNFPSEYVNSEIVWKPNLKTCLTTLLSKPPSDQEYWLIVQREKIDGAATKIFSNYPFERNTHETKLIGRFSRVYDNPKKGVRLNKEINIFFKCITCHQIRCSEEQWQSEVWNDYRDMLPHQSLLFCTPCRTEFKRIAMNFREMPKLPKWIEKTLWNEP